MALTFGVTSIKSLESINGNPDFFQIDQIDQIFLSITKESLVANVFGDGILNLLSIFNVDTSAM